MWNHAVDGVVVGNPLQEIDVPDPHAGAMRIADNQHTGQASAFRCGRYLCRMWPTPPAKHTVSQ